MKHLYDVVVIGSGVAGKAAAVGLAKADKKVAVIENDLWGGTCPNRGCDPKKVLTSAVEAQNKAYQLKGNGIEDIPSINWSDLMAFKKTFTDPVPEQSKDTLKSAGADTFYGTATFINEHTLEVDNDTFDANQFIIATGARPSILDIKGKEHFLTSNDFLSLPEMPGSITFIGAGYIAFEFAAIASAAGAEVHVVQHNASPLKAYDLSFVHEVMNHLKSKGVTFHLETSVTEIEKVSNRFKLTDDHDFMLTTDAVFCTSGRAPNTDKLNLEKAHVDYDTHGIKVNEYLQTSNASIYALGDILSKKQPKLTPVSSLEASYIVSLLTGETDEGLAYPSVPSIVFSSPRLAQVGVTVKEAGQDPSKYELSTIDATNWFSYKRLNESVSRVKIIIEKETGLLVGASCLNNEADELINYFSLLIDQKIKTDALSKVMFAYPTIASDLSFLYG